MKKPLHIAIAGLSTVGGGTFKLLHENAQLIEARAGRPLKIVAVSARDKTKKRVAGIEKVQWLDNALDLVNLPEVDIIVETIGGAEGVAKSLVEAALKAGKHVVTANKALIAHHGLKLAQLAEEKNVVLAYEAAVAAGIPVIKSLREGLAANRFHNVAGIMNGTCNFILSSMWEQRRDFDWALTEAQKIGYAEADPSFDIDGIDTAHKIAILTSLAFGCPVDFKSVNIEGIRDVSILDMEYAAELGYVIKLLAQSSLKKDGVLQRVHPCMVPRASTLGRLSGAYNGIIIDGDAAGRITLEGLGAGEGPTSSSMVGDIIDIARGASYKPFSIPVAQLKALPTASMDKLTSAYYVRMTADATAPIHAVFEKVGIALQKTKVFAADNQPQRVVCITQETQEHTMKTVLALLKTLECVSEGPQMIRMEAL
jgi:homoserine dehydrogenase